MEWRAAGLLLSVRRHGESAAIIEVFTEEHGRCAGMVRGGGGRRMAPVLQPGAELEVTWRARLEEHLGNFTVELVRGRAAELMSDRAGLAALASVTALAAFLLPERQAYPKLFGQTVTVLDLLSESDLWPYAYLRWEVALLAEMGFGLDLSRCAVSGATDDLAYVSPKTGRAVSTEGAGDWADRLLPLSASLRGDPQSGLTDILTGLSTTGYFLERRLASSLGDKSLPTARQRLIAALERQTGIPPTA